MESINDEIIRCIASAIYMNKLSRNKSHDRALLNQKLSKHYSNYATLRL